MPPPPGWAPARLARCAHPDPDAPSTRAEPSGHDCATGPTRQRASPPTPTMVPDHLLELSEFQRDLFAFEMLEVFVRAGTRPQPRPCRGPPTGSNAEFVSTPSHCPHPRNVQYTEDKPHDASHARAAYRSRLPGEPQRSGPRPDTGKTLNGRRNVVVMTPTTFKTVKD